MNLNSEISIQLLHFLMYRMLKGHQMCHWCWWWCTVCLWMPNKIFYLCGGQTVHSTTSPELYSEVRLCYKSIGIESLVVKHATEGCNNTCTLNTKYIELLDISLKTVSWYVVLLFNLVKIYHFWGTCFLCYVGRRKSRARKNSAVYVIKWGQPLSEAKQ